MKFQVSVKQIEEFKKTLFALTPEEKMLQLRAILEEHNTNINMALNIIHKHDQQIKALLLPIRDSIRDEIGVIS